MQNICYKWMMWCIETFYIITKNANLGSSTIYLLSVDMIENANSKLITKTHFYMI